jgi:hypothetical protein
MESHSGKLAQALVVAAFKVVLPNLSTRVEGLTEIADVISRGTGSRRSKNSLRRRLEDAVDLLTDRLSDFEKIEFSNVPPAERLQAIEAICGVFESLDVNQSTIIRQGLDPNKLLHSLEPALRIAWRERLLSERAVGYGEKFLHESCRYVTSMRVTWRLRTCC